MGETDCGEERGETSRKEITCHLHLIGPILTRPPLEGNALWKWREAVNLLLHTMTLFCEFLPFLPWRTPACPQITLLPLGSLSEKQSSFSQPLFLLARPQLLRSSWASLPTALHSRCLLVTCCPPSALSHVNTQMGNLADPCPLPTNLFLYPTSKTHSVVKTQPVSSTKQ